jgi:hypothetical protein
MLRDEAHPVSEGRQIASPQTRNEHLSSESMMSDLRADAKQIVRDVETMLSGSPVVTLCSCASSVGKCQWCHKRDQLVRLIVAAERRGAYRALREAAERIVGAFDLAETSIPADLKQAYDRACDAYEEEQGTRIKVAAWLRARAEALTGG